MLAVESSDAGDGVVHQRREFDPWVQDEDDRRGEGYLNAHGLPAILKITDSGDIDAHYRQVTVGTLPDVALLEIFIFYVDETGRSVGWRKLVRVCRRWRHIVFASQNRLHLQLHCTESTPVREMLDVWPALPLIVSNRRKLAPVKAPGAESNIMAALQHHDRVCEIDLWYVPGWLLESLSTVTMAQEQYPELTSLELRSNDGSAPVLPNSFLGGSAPRLRSLVLDSIPFPGLRKLLLTASNLIQLHLNRIPNSGYISPDAMVACVLTMNNLESFTLEYSSPRSRPERASRRPPPLTRVVLPSLARFRFHGASEYLEEFLAQVDTPLLNSLHITFFNQLAFDLSQLPQFISRTEKIKALTQAALAFYNTVIEITLSTQTQTVADRGMLVLRVSSRESDWQLSSLAQLCSSALPLLSTLERLNIHEHPFWGTHWQGDMENTQWMEFLGLFTAMEGLYLSNGVALRVARALQGLAREGVVTDMLPSLRNIFVEGLQLTGSVHEAIGQFIAARQLSDHPLTVGYWI